MPMSLWPYFKYDRLCLKNCLSSIVGLQHAWSVMFTHPKTVSCAKAAQATLQMILKSAPSRNKPQNAALAKEVTAEGRFQPHCKAASRALRPSLSSVQMMRKIAHGTLTAFNPVLEDAQTSVHNLMGQRHFIFYTIIICSYPHASLSKSWHIPQIWNPFSHSSYTSNYVAVGDHNSFGNSCGSTCIHDHCNIRRYRPGLLFVSCNFH